MTPIAEESLKFHYEKKGKIEVVSTVQVGDAHDLSLAYTPGVAQPCLEIQKDVNKSYEQTGGGTCAWWSPTARRCWAWGTSAPRRACR